MKKVYLLLFFIVSFQQSHAQWVDQSTKPFFPEHEGKMFSIYQKMPATWWNFFFYDKKKLTQEEVCAIFSQINSDDILFSPCSTFFVGKPWLFSWAKDSLFSQPPPSSTTALENLLNSTLIRMSLPQDSNLLDIQRSFPLTDFSKIQKSIGHFYQIEENSNDWGVLPVLLNFSPQETDKTLLISNLFEDSRHKKLIHAIGPHFGSLSNKSLIINDLKTVMSLGLILLLILFSYLFLTKKKLFFILVPCLFFSVFLSSLIVIFIWGSIHGLTLAFGSGLIGISMDYAFHGWPERHKSQVWKSNFISFLTTFSAFALLSFFSIPLIKQLSLFSLCGLTISFVITYFISKKAPPSIRPRAASIKPKTLNFYLSISLIGLLILISISSALFNKVDFSLMRMDSTQSQNVQLMKNSSHNMSKSQYAFLMNQFHGFEHLDQQHQWADENNIPYLGVTSLRGQNKDYTQHHKQWLNFTCSADYLEWKDQLSPQLKKIFSEFLTSIDCLKMKKNDHSLIKDHLKLFVSKGHSLSIFRFMGEEQKTTLITQFPDIFFVSEITQKFPEKLRSEISYFLIFVLTSVCLILLFFFRKMTFLTFIPTLGAAAFAFGVHILFNNPLSFMSFISLIILLGLTLDFGVFSTSCFIWKKPLNSTLGSITLSAMTSLAGFAPLALCSHPVLRDLGLTITAGVLGAYLATCFIYPGLKSKLDGDLRV